MSNPINNVSTASTAPNQIFEQFEKLAGESTMAKDVIGKAMEVLAGANVKVTRSDATGADGVAEKKTTGATSTPALDNPADVKQVEANLEKLVMYLQLDNDKRQAEMAKSRIDMQKATLEKEHKGRMKEINKSLNEMAKAQRASLASRIFGWLGAIVAAVAAVVTTFVTGGMAGAFAIAGAVMAITNLALNESGAMKKITNKMAESMEKTFNLTPTQARRAAELTLGITMLVVQIGFAVGALISASSQAAGVAAKAASVIGKTVQNYVGWGAMGIGVGAIAAGGVNTIMNYNSQRQQANVTELEKFLQLIQQCLDESQEELQQILQQIQSGTGKVAEIITSATDTSAEISRKIGAMA